MSEKLRKNLEALRHFVEERNWDILEEKEIESGHQVKVFDGTDSCSVNLYETGRIVAQGKVS
ncbi:MAG: hypothetical protein SNJ72_09980, partial [Fimbriimonadales bacterium]